MGFISSAQFKFRNEILKIKLNQFASPQNNKIGKTFCISLFATSHKQTQKPASDTRNP